MKIGLLGSNLLFADAADATEHVRLAESLGFESVWAADHVVVPLDYDSVHPYGPDRRIPGGENASFPEPLVWLAAVGCATRRIHLGTGVLAGAQRDPLLLGKTAATVDRMTSGRLLLGMGLGWLTEERAALGMGEGKSGDRVREVVEILRKLWTGEPAQFDGRYFRFDPVYCRPTPLRRSIPIIIGGHTPAAARRAGRLGDGFFTWDVGAGEFAGLVKEMRVAAADAGRDPEAIELTAGILRLDGDDLHRFEEAGATRVVVPATRHLHQLADSLLTCRRNNR